MKTSIFVGALTALALGTAAAAFAQEQVAEAAAPSAPAATPPLPAVMARNAQKGLLLGIARTGDQLVAVGGNGVILRSADGSAWTQIASPVDVALTGIAFATAQRGWAVGHDALILGTEDGGQSWQVQSAQPDLYSPLFAVQPLSDTRVLAVGAFGLLKLTEDGGKTWSDLSAPEITEQKFHLNAITRLASGKLLVAGEQGLLGVSDDGTTWTRLPSPYAGSFFGVLPWSEGGAVAFGMRGNVFVTADLAQPDWKPVDMGSTASLYGGQALEDGSVILTGAEGRVVLLGPDAQPRLLISAEASQGQASSLTGAASSGQGLVIVGDQGVLRIPAPR